LNPPQKQEQQQAETDSATRNARKVQCTQPQNPDFDQLKKKVDSGENQDERRDDLEAVTGNVSDQKSSSFATMYLVLHLAHCTFCGGVSSRIRANLHRRCVGDRSVGGGWHCSQGHG